MKSKDGVFFGKVVKCEKPNANDVLGGEPIEKVAGTTKKGLFPM